MKATVTVSGRAYVRSFSRHSAIDAAGSSKMNSPNCDGEIAGVVLDRRDVVDRLAEPSLLGVDQPRERAALDVDEVRDVKDLVQTREGAARPEGVYARHGRRLLVGSEADGMGRGSRREKARTTKIAQRGGPLWGAYRRSRTPPAAPRMWRGSAARTAATIGRLRDRVAGNRGVRHPLTPISRSTSSWSTRSCPAPRAASASTSTASRPQRRGRLRRCTRPTVGCASSGTCAAASASLERGVARELAGALGEDQVRAHAAARELAHAAGVLDPQRVRVEVPRPVVAGLLEQADEQEHLLEVLLPEAEVLVVAADPLRVEVDVEELAGPQRERDGVHEVQARPSSRGRPPG